MNLRDALAEQVASVPLLSTVLRIDIALSHSPQARADAVNLLMRWINERTEANDLGFAWKGVSLPFVSGDFSLDWAENEDNFVFTIERPDSRQVGRTWLIEVSLNRIAGQNVLATRLALRQPRSAPIPSARSPKFIAEAVEVIGARDVVPLASGPSHVDAESSDSFVSLLLNPSRTLPIVAVSEDDRRSEYLIDPVYLASLLVGVAHVVTISQDASKLISDDPGKGKLYSVYRGAVRCFNAGFNFHCNPREHKLWLDSEVLRLESFRRNAFADTAVRHCFSQVTASFEALPLASPRSVRRQAELAEVAALRDRSCYQQPITQALPETTGEIQVEAIVEETESPKTLELIPVEALQQELMVATERLEEEVRSRAIAEAEYERVGQALRAENADLALRMKEEAELRQMYESENLELQRQLDIYTGKVSKDSDTLSSRFLRAFSDAFGSASILIDRQTQLERETTIATAEIEELRDELAEARKDRFRLASQIEGLSLRAEAESAAFKGSVSSGAERQSWGAMLAFAKDMFANIAFAADIEEQLAPYPFQTGISDRVVELLEILDEIAEETGADSRLSAKGIEIQQAHFVGNGSFSSESDTNKRDFKSELTFRDPSDATRKIECPWHGKISQGPFRIHFEWPRPKGQRVIKVVYIGPKITKH